MRVVYSDPLRELKTLIAQAKSDPQINHIAITPGELRSCLTHAEAGSVFPQLMNEREKDLVRVRNQLKKIRPMIAGNVLSDREKQPLFDQVDQLEAEEEAITQRIPHTITEGGVVIKVSMR